jgi:tetratricopeptide (TPR) repeat protein
MENEKLGIATYPRAGAFHGGLGGTYARLGQYESAISFVQQELALHPRGPIPYEVLMDMYVALDRLDKARSVYEQAKALGLNAPDFHISLYALAFVQHDAPAMEREAALLDSIPGVGNEIPCARASSESYFGRSRKAHELTLRAVKSIAAGGLNETAATCLARRAFEEALAGEHAAAHADASEALNRAVGRDVETLAAYAFASTGEENRAQTLAKNLANRLPLDTLLNSVYLPTLHAGLAIRRGDAAWALELLEPVRPFDTGFLALVPMYPAYVRGEAYLRSGQGDKAAKQFQQVLEHPGLVGNCLVGALARLGLARAFALEAGRGGTAVPAVKNHVSNTGETAVPRPDALAKARAAYQDFFTLWKDADPDIPVLKEAKAEYAKLK